MDFRTAALGALLLAWALPLSAQPSPPDSAATDPALSLSDLLQLADANPSVRAARLGAEAQARAADAAGRRPDPTASVMVFPAPVVTARGSQRTQWRVEQRMPWPGTLGLRADAARTGAARTRAEAEAFALDLALEIQQAYFDGARAVQLLALLRPFRERLDAFADAAAARYEVGRGPQAALLQIGLERARLGEREVQLVADADDARYRIGQLLDRPGVQVEFDAGDALAIPERAPSAASRPEIAALDAAQVQAEAEAALAQKAFYPDLGAALTYFDIADRDAPPMADGADAFAVSVSATIPLDRAGRRALLDAARLRQAQLEAQRDALTARLQADADRARAQLDAATETLLLYRDGLLPQADAAVESALAAYATGEADYTVVLDAERARFQVRTGLEDARFRLLAARARLGRALGRTPLP